MNNVSSVTIKGQVTIPSTIRKSLNLNKGARVYFVQKNEEIIVKKSPGFFELKGSIKSQKNFSENNIDTKLRKKFKKDHA